jgi:phenylpyruvate tautomerase PptA (4-oxalocrotonate tautomerase family)
MAFARVEVIGEWSDERKAAAVDGVRRAMSEALRVPADDPTVILVEHPPANVAIPMGLGRGYAIVTVTMFSGRSDTAKRALVEAITAALTTAGAEAREVDVLLQEQPRGHWARGAHLASDYEPNLQVEI